MPFYSCGGVDILEPSTEHEGANLRLLKAGLLRFIGVKEV